MSIQNPLSGGGTTQPSKLLTVDVQPHPRGVPLMRVLGDVDLATAPVFQKAVQEQVAQRNKFVVDLDGVDFLSSAGLAVLVDLRQQMEDQKLKWAVVAARQTVTRPLEITGLLTLLPIFGTVPAALDAVTN
ncbi:STAS domain-containing protein [Kibdelosporangium philippinense]|uniref:Anti-sigma factor antagonist n=1 Tax=Kibdelosporangium philippinense TaxID=211113 RepID=A0ABS8Z6K2_9PSEU|nr:STAS domain-containing protein [Kibdelosporangium philippinense]MCE7003511.1 STAS domain-containing protein [Kibdelosporangium philippinense]